MKKIALGLGLFTLLASACNDSETPKETSAATAVSTGNTEAVKNTKVKVTLQELVAQYLQLKNALAADNAADAASAGKAMTITVEKMDKTSLTADESSTWENIGPDVHEHGEHISDNAKDIAHQREHFDMLSKDMIDLVKVFGSPQKLYKDFCPMYNEDKGAAWLSETEEIKNPYFGAKMLKCGTIKEEF